MDRRSFVKHAAAATAVTAGVFTFGCGKGRRAAIQGDQPSPAAAAAKPSPSLASASSTSSAAGKVGRNRHDPKAGAVNAAVATGTDAAIMLAAAMKALGGADQFVHAGDLVCIKPNLAWGRTPGTGADTSPEVLAATIKMCQQAGAKEILVVEHPCDSSKVTFDMSGAARVCRDLGVKLIAMETQSMYREVPLAQGVTLRSELIPNELLDCDCYINLPCAKVHSASVVTLALKNQMGAVWEPQRYHRGQSEAQQGGNLHQNIVDLASGLRPTLTIIDGARTLLTGGPKGPGKAVKSNKLIVSADFVAADAIAAPLLNTKPHLVDHIRIAGESGIGTADPAQLRIAHIA